MPYLTGDTVPVTRKCRTIHVPDDPAFMAAVSGQLIELLYPENWEKHGALTPAQMADAFRLAYYEFADSHCIEEADIIYPGNFNLSVLDAFLSSGTTLLRGTNTSQIYNAQVEVSPFTALGNTLRWSVYCTAGQYDVTVLGARGTNYGDLSLNVDGGTYTAAQSAYNATAANNIFYVYDLTFPTDGNHTIFARVSGKNASSSAYRFIFSALYGRYRQSIP